MSDRETDEQPMIRFAGVWVPAHEVWKRMESATVVVEHLERFNTKFPNLSSKHTRDVVPLVRQRLKEIELRMPSKEEDVADIGDIAAQLLESQSIDETLETLAEQHDVSLSAEQLVHVAGEDAFLKAMRREAREFVTNRVSPEQNAQLWNEQGRPAPGGGLWSPTKVIALLGGD